MDFDFFKYVKAIMTTKLNSKRKHSSKFYWVKHIKVILFIIR